MAQKVGKLDALRAMREAQASKKLPAPATRKVAARGAGKMVQQSSRGSVGKARPSASRSIAAATKGLRPEPMSVAPDPRETKTGVAQKEEHPPLKRKDAGSRPAASASKYRDPDKRRAYMRDLMRKRRAEKK